MLTTLGKYLQPKQKHHFTSSDLAGFKKVQRLSYECVETIAKEIQEGWTEIQTAKLMRTYLQDHGVNAFFHEPYAWFGNRTRFDGIKRNRPKPFMPCKIAHQENQVIILDVSPILNGYIGDIGYTVYPTQNKEAQKAKRLLKQLRKDIPEWVMENPDKGALLCQRVDEKIKKSGFDNIHHIYPFHVLGHRVRRVPFWNSGLRTPVNFSLHSFFQVIASGFTSELLNETHKGSLTGLWAIEPHVGGSDFGAKFEEILVITKDGQAHWLDNEVPHA